MKKLENGVSVNVNAVPVAGTTSVNTIASMTAAASVQNDSLNTFMEENNKKQETMVTIGFVMAIVGLLLSFVGVTYGVILIILEYYFAIQGLKTTKRGFAIATIVIASVSILGIILGIVKWLEILAVY